MDKYTYYTNELNMLLKDEKKISFFCNLVHNDKRDKMEENSRLINYVISFCEEHKLNEAKAWMLYYLGWNYSDMSDTVKAAETFNEARVIFEKNDNKNGMAYAFNGLSSVYCQEGQYELATAVGLRGIFVAKQAKDRDILFKLLINASISNLKCGSYESAKEILLYIYENYELELKDTILSIFYKKTAAEVEVNMNNNEIALQHIKEAIDLDEELVDSIYTTELYKILAMCYVALSRYEAAEAAFKFSYRVADESNSLYEKCETLIEWAKLKIIVNENDTAISFLNSSAEIATKINLMKLVAVTNYEQYIYYKNIGDFKNALIYLESHKKIENDLNNKQGVMLMTKLNIEYGQKEVKLDELLQNKTELISSIGQNIISMLSVEDIFKYIDTQITKLFKADYFGVTIYEEENNELVLITTVDGKMVIDQPRKLDQCDTLGKYCIVNKKSIIIDDIREEYQKYLKAIELEGRGINSPLSYVYIPLIVNDKPIGAMSVQSLKANAYDNNDVNLLKVIGNYAAIALKNAIEYKKMEQIAIYDSLTGFLTKREILKEGNLVRADYVKTQKCFCIIMIDMDNFKSVNDTYGHLAGDEVIRLVTQTINRLIRTSDYIGRYGGDEFLLVCPGLSGKNGLKLAERLRKAIEMANYILEDGQSINVTVSLGVYEFNNEELSFIDGVNCADITLYRAKSSNKNKVMVY